MITTRHPLGLSIAVCFGVVALAACAVDDGEEAIGEAESAHRKRHDEHGYSRLDIQPLADADRAMMTSYHDPGWLFDKGGKAHAAGCELYGSPGPANTWIFGRKSGGETKLRVLIGAPQEPDTGGDEIVVESDGSLRPKHRGGQYGACNVQACRDARETRKKAYESWRSKSSDLTQGLAYGLGWQKALCEVDKACDGC